MSQKLPVGGSEWVKNTSPFNKDTDEGYFLEVDV